MKRRQWLPTSGVVFIAAIGAACSGGASDQHTNSAAAMNPQPQPAAQPEHVWSGQVQALEKAKGVEGTLMEATHQHDEEMNRQGQ